MRILNNAEINNLVDEFYTNSSEDIVGFFSIAKEVAEIIGDEDIAREQTLRVVRILLTKGMAAGNPPYLPGGYKPWTNQDADAVINRIRSEWLQLGHAPGIADIAWFGPPK